MDICSICKEEFATTEEYLNHTCSTGFKPSEFAHQVALDPNYEAVSASALERGKQS